MIEPYCQNNCKIKKISSFINRDAFQNGGGFTLIEMLVAVSIFVLAIGAISGIFVSSLRAQRQSLANQEILDQVSYVAEYMSRAIRMAKKDITGGCLTTAGTKHNYETNVARDRIRFLNYQNKCQEFFLQDDQLKEQKSVDNTAAGFTDSLDLTSASLQVNSFVLGDSTTWDQNDDEQPLVTFILDITGKEQSSMIIQTSISQRNPDVIR